MTGRTINLINLDHAATESLRAEALRAMLSVWEDPELGNPSATHGMGRRARARLEAAREEIAACIGAEPQEIFFTGGGTEADCWALSGTAAARGNKGSVAVSAIEHHAVLRAAESLERQGVPVVRVPPDGDVIVSPEAVRAALAGAPLSPFLVSVMLVNNEVGTIEPISGIAEAAHAAGALMHTDAVQAVGHIPVDADGLGVDLLSASAHKFGGPAGVGFLYIRKGTRIRPLLAGGGQERGLRGGTENLAGAAGMAAALSASVREMETECVRLAGLRDWLLSAILAGTEGVRVNGTMRSRLPGNLHLSIDGADQNALLTLLDMKGVCASAGSACEAGSTERSHVLAAMGKDEGQAYLRLTLGRGSTEEETGEAAAVITETIHHLRSMDS